MLTDKNLAISFKLAANETDKLYFQNLKKQVEKALETANNARSLKLDPKPHVEIYIAEDVASRTEGLVGPPGIAKRLKTLESEKLTKDEIVIEIAQEICEGKFFHADPEELAEQALRTALSYQTEGITAAPIEGISKVRIKNNLDGTAYLAIYYAGPIRSAGGTAQGISVYVADVIRKKLGLDRYKATEQEIERMLEEVRLYNKIMHLQLFTTDEELKYAWKNIPIMITGEPTEKEEVGGYRNLESMETNRVRGGAALVLNDGLVGRSLKIMKRIKKLQLQGWDWLEEIANKKFRKKIKTSKENQNKKKSVQPDPSFANDALMGRPNFSDPTAKGGFRLRYGHARCTGIAAIGIHPGTMGIVNDFLASGTHIRTERPGKGSIVTPIDSIKPPIVLLKSGEVKQISSYVEGKNSFSEVTQILFLGDVLIGYGEFLQNDYNLCPSGYVEEWWIQELKQNSSELAMKYQNQIPTLEESLDLSKKFKLALHPSYLFTWKYITPNEIVHLYDSIKTENELPISVKPILERILLPHRVKGDKIVLYQSHFDSLLLQFNLYPDFNKIDLPLVGDLNSLEYINQISEIDIRDLMGTTVGARMGRPEKAKERKMKPALHGLFSLGKDKKIKRLLSNALEFEEILVKVGNRICQNCETDEIYNFCSSCFQETTLIGKCANRKCNRTQIEGPCDFCGYPVKFHKTRPIKIKEIFKQTQQRLGQISQLNSKFLEELKNPTGTAELLDKGILRSFFDLHVFRDGTIRYDATDAPLTHFHPREINASVSKLRKLGYTYDMDGDDLISEEQLVEMKVQDIILHKSAAKHLLDVTQFVDLELQKIYNLPAYYNCNKRSDLIGKLVIGLAPHTSAGVIGRIIGFSDSSVCWAHPYWHSSKRRNCDGDEDGLIMLLDGFLNFSKEYLPTTRGSKMDTPLVLVANLNPKEVDDEAFNMEVVKTIPKKLYLVAEELGSPKEVEKEIDIIENRLGHSNQFHDFHFTHTTSNISDGPKHSKYKDGSLSFREKLDMQLELARKIYAVHEVSTALRILEKHVLPDLMGNLRAFGSQQFRCVSCNSKFRRIPLSGKCSNVNCVRSKIILTVPPKGVTKYYDICQRLIEEFDLPKYHHDRLDKIKLAIDSHFPEEGSKQLDLSEWF